MASPKICIEEISDYFDYRNGYPRPAWELIQNWVDGLPADSDFHFVWTEVVANWLGRLSDHLQDNYSIWESQNFLIVCNRAKADCERLVLFCERARRQILETLGKVVVDEGFGKIVILILTDSDDYYDYVSDWYPDDGEFGGSSGMFLSGHYPHIVVFAGPSALCEATIAHELTHFFLRHLDLPLWLNEGITQIVEREIAGLWSQERDQELSRKHAKWWNSATIQEFWTGTSFSAADDRQQLSYDLALQMVSQLLHRFPQTFAEFLSSASSVDAGDAALWNSCRLSLNQCVADILGNQDWSPKRCHTHETIRETDAQGLHSEESDIQPRNS